MTSRTLAALTLTGGLLALASGALSSTALAGDVHAVTEGNRIVTFDDATPGTLDQDHAITGLALDENVIAIDLHPSCDGRLFALTDQDRLYTIDPATGAATVAHALSAAPGTTEVGGAFDPESQLWRVVDSADGNRTIDVETGTVTAETGLQFDIAGPDNGRDPAVSGLAFVEGRFVGIDTDLDELLALDPAADGTLARIGRLGVDASAPVGLVYRHGDGTLFASLNVGGLGGLYGIDPATGHIRFLGTIGAGTPVIDIAAAPAPPPVLAIEKLDLKFNYKKSGKDKVHLRGTLPAPEGDVNGLVATVDIGGVQRTFTLGSNGRGTQGLDSFHLIGEPEDGRVIYDVMFKKGSFAGDLADENMGGDESAKKAARQVIAIVTLGDATYGARATLEYTAKAGKTGIAKLDAKASTPVEALEGCPPPAPPVEEEPFTIEIRGNKTVVTLAAGTPDASPVTVSENNGSATVQVPSDQPIRVVIAGNKNEVEIPAALASNVTVDDQGNKNTTRNLP